MELKFHTDLTKEESIKRLNESLKHKFFSSERKDIVGRVRGDKVFFRNVQQMALRAFNNSFSGTLQSVANGTDIVGRINSWTLQNILEVILFVFLFLVINSYGDITLLIISIVVFGLIAVFQVFLNNRVSKQGLVDFVKKTCDAEQVN